MTGAMDEQTGCDTVMWSGMERKMRQEGGEGRMLPVETREERAIEQAWGHVGERSLEGDAHEPKRGHAETLQVRWCFTSGVFSVLSFCKGNDNTFLTGS